jgi:DNA modification methylase
MSNKFCSLSQTLIFGDNKALLSSVAGSINLAYCDVIYENEDVTWVEDVYEKVETGGIIIIQTDWHTNYLYRSFLEQYLGANFVNHLVWKNEWGNHPKNRFHQCYDDILIFSKGKDYKFYPDRIQVPKATANTKLNPSGRITKNATAWIDDITLTTTAKERVKDSTGKNVRWQKPLKLYDRIILPFTDNFDIVLDPFMGVCSLGRWSRLNNRNYIGMEIDEKVYEIAVKNFIT